MLNTYFIDTDVVLKSGVMSQNIDPQFIKRAIARAQETFIQQILGTDLYNELQTQAGTDPTTLTAANATLLNDYVIPALIPRAQYHALYFLWAKITNKTVGTKGGDNITPVSSTDILTAKNEFAAESFHYGNLAIAYLCAEQADYPALKTNNKPYKYCPVGRVMAMAGGISINNARPKRMFQDAMGVGYVNNNWQGLYGQPTNGWQGTYRDYGWGW